jgi:methionyl-tRNA formyltransferase
VLTQPDRPAGRGLKLQASAVKQLAQQHGLPVAQPRSLKLDGRWPEDAESARAWLQAAQLDVLVVAAYGLILPAWVLSLPRRGCLNIHASLLPRWRGAAPIQRAIEAGDTRTGITIMQMDEGLDTGDMLLTGEQPILDSDTSDSLLKRLAIQGATLIVDTLRHLETDLLDATPQPQDGVTYAHKIDKAESAIDWQLDARLIERRLRAFDPFPGAASSIDGHSIKIWRAACVDLSAGDSASVASPGTVTEASARSLRLACGLGQLQLLALQPPGGRRLPVEVFMQTPIGRTLRPGQRFQT